MQTYAHFGHKDFIICLGYKGYIIKEFFNNYFLHKSDITVDLRNNKVIINESDAEPWTITLVDTGVNSMTGGRIKRIQKHIGKEPFFLTYGDGLSDVNIPELLETHKKSKKYLTVTSVQPQGRFGALNLSPSNGVLSFLEKPKGDGSWINGGYFVCQPEVFDYISGDETIFEKDPMEKLANEGQMQAYLHNGFWRPMDTLRDKIELEELWNLNNKTPWKKW